LFGEKTLTCDVLKTPPEKRMIAVPRETDNGGREVRVVRKGKRISSQQKQLMIRRRSRKRELRNIRIRYHVGRDCNKIHEKTICQKRTRKGEAKKGRCRGKQGKLHVREEVKKPPERGEIFTKARRVTGEHLKFSSAVKEGDRRKILKKGDLVK